MPNDHEKHSPDEQEWTGSETQWTEDESSIAEAFSQLSNVQVSNEFLPSVMGKVFVHHTRANISLWHVAAVTVILITLSALFFGWDVREYQQATGLTHFSEAFLHMMGGLVTNMDHSFADATGILAACWHMLAGLIDLATQPQNLMTTAVILVLLAIGAFAIKKWLESLRKSH